MSLTPVIDVVFLLLLFFMLASTFSRYARVEVGIGGKASPTAMPDQAPLIFLSVRADGGFSVNGAPVAIDAIAPALAAASKDGKARIAIRAAKNTLAEHIVQAVEQAQAARLGPVMLVK